MPVVKVGWRGGERGTRTGRGKGCRGVGGGQGDSKLPQQACPPKVDPCLLRDLVNYPDGASTRWAE